VRNALVLCQRGVDLIAPDALAGIEVHLGALSKEQRRREENYEERHGKDGQAKASAAELDGLDGDADLREVLGYLEDSKDAEQAHHSKDDQGGQIARIGYINISKYPRLQHEMAKSTFCGHNDKLDVEGQNGEEVDNVQKVQEGPSSNNIIPTWSETK